MIVNPGGLLALSLAALLFSPKGPPFFDPDRSLDKQREAAKEAKEAARTQGPEVAQYLVDPSVQVRDDVFDVLVDRASPQLLEAFAGHLRGRDEFLAASVAELYGACRYAAGRESLEKYGLRSRGELAALEAVWALEALGDPASAPALEKAFKRGHPGSEFRVRGDALIALAAVAPSRARELCGEALEHKLPPLRIAGIEALRRIDRREAARAAVSLIGADELPRRLGGWEARILFAALDSLETWYERAADAELMISAIDALIARLGRADGLSRYRIALTLADLTAQAPLGDDVESWQSWWGPRRDGFQAQDKLPPEPKKEKKKKKKKADDADEPEDAEDDGPPGRPLTGDAMKTRVRFHGIPIHSNRLLFAQDISGGMNNPVDRDDAASPTKLKFSNDELKRVLGALDDDVMANIAFFATEYEFTASSLLPVKKVRRQLIEFVGQKAVTPDGKAMGRSNLYDTLVTAFGDPQIDTVFFLSEGGPTEGRYLDPDRFMTHLQRLNVYSRVQVHCLQVTTSSFGEKFLRRLADETGGRFYDLEFIKRAHGL